VTWLSRLLSGEPHFYIGGSENPYLRRWYLLPRVRLGTIYLHNILRNDDDRALHDHPGDNVSIVLRGTLREILPCGSRVLWRGAVVYRRAEDAHRLEVVDGPVWTLFITGKWERDWGFWCPQGFVPWRKFVDPLDSGKVGPGCGATLDASMKHDTMYQVN